MRDQPGRSHDRRGVLTTAGAFSRPPVLSPFPGQSACAAAAGFDRHGLNPEADITLADLAGHVAALEEKLDETLMVHTLTVDMLTARTR